LDTTLFLCKYLNVGFKHFVFTMADEELADKEAYFKEQALLDLSEDEQDLRDEASSNLERALQDSKAMPPLSWTDTQRKTGRVRGAYEKTTSH
jgi:hypothetical protein